MDKKAKCSNRKCGWIGLESQMREVVIERGCTELHCPRCDCNSFYYKLKEGETEKKKSGSDLIALERNRQIKIEGYDEAQDDSYKSDELLKAAVAYIFHEIN